MGNKRVAGLCRCPYYQGERENAVVCEGVIAGTRCESRFRTRRDRQCYQEVVCADGEHPDDYQCCPVYRAVSRRYEEGSL